MDPAADITEDLRQLQDKFRAKLGAGAGALPDANGAVARRLPRRLRTRLARVAAAARLAGHPRLAPTLDRRRLRADIRALEAHLDAIDLGERRKDLWLGIAGAVAFNLIVIFTLFVLFLRWRGIV